MSAPKHDAPLEIGKVRDTGEWIWECWECVEIVGDYCASWAEALAAALAHCAKAGAR